MTLRKTLLLSALLAAILLYIFKIEVPRVETEKGKTRPFAKFTVGALKSLEIARNAQTFTLVNGRPETPDVQSAKKDGAEAELSAANWSLAGIDGAQIDQASLNGLITPLLSLDTESALPESETGTDLSVYGLKTPPLTINVAALNDDHTSTTLYLQFGKKNEYLGKRYLRITGSDYGAGGALFVVPEAIFTAANKDKNDFRKKTPLDLKAGDLTQIVFEQGAQRLVLARADENGSSKWKITEPGNFPASESSINSAVGTLNTIRVKNYLDGQEAVPEKFNFANPEAGLTLHFKEELKRAPLKLHFSKGRQEQAENKDSYLLTSESKTIFGLEKDPVADLFKPALAYREKNFFKFDSWRTREVTFTPANGEPVTILSKNGDYEVNGKPGEAGACWNLLAALAALEASDFPQEISDYGFNEPRLKVLVKAASADSADGGTKAAVSEAKLEEHSLVVGAAAGKDNNGEADSYFARVGDAGLPFIISKESFEKIRPDLSSLVKAEPVAAAPTN